MGGVRYYVLERDLDRDDAFELEEGLELVQVVRVIRGSYDRALDYCTSDRVVLVAREAGRPE